MLTDEELDRACTIELRHEQLIPWLYCDNKGYITVGVGDKVSAETVLTMPFVHQSDGRPATSDEKLAAYYRVQDFFHKGLTASAYTACSDLRLPVDFCARRVRYRIKAEFVPAIEKQCPQFASFPLSAKLVLVDIAYNVGTVGFVKFAQLIVDCNNRAFDFASLQVHTAKEGEDPKRPETWGSRNRWRRETMLQAAQHAQP